MASADYVVETDGLSKRFGERLAVDSVDLRIPRGSAFGYLGPNGAGKTTLIRMLLGLTPPTAGTYSVLGRPMPAERREALAKVGAIVEEPGFHPHLTGRENLWIVAAAREPVTHSRIPAVLARVGLTERANDRVKTYSLGMRQRLGVARCLLADPELLILDEPTNGLDPAGIQEFRELVESLLKEGRTVILSSHILHEVEKICDHVAIVDRGKIVAQGTIAELSAREQASIAIGCDDPEAARTLIAGQPGIGTLEPSAEGLRITLAADADLNAVAATANTALVKAGISVHRLEPSHASLERIFLDITSRLGEEEPA